MYLYIYNPSGLQFSDNGNTVQLAVKYNSVGAPSDYEKFELLLCSKSTSEQYLLFYKFKVIDRKGADGKTIAERVNGASRRYDVSGIELLEKGQDLPKDYGAGGTYTYTGYAEGYGSEGSPALSCTVKDADTVELKTHDTFYNYANTPYKQQQLTSVYFSVPNRYFKTYGDKLQDIKAEWYEYKTQPMIVTYKSEVYDGLKPFIGVDVPGTNPSIPYNLYIPGGDGLGNDWAYNISVKPIERMNKLTFLCLTEKGKAIRSEELLQKAKAYPIGSGSVDCGTYSLSSDLFLPVVDEGRTRGKNTAVISADYNFTLFGANTDFWTQMFLWFSPFKDSVVAGDIADVSPIYKVIPEDIKKSDYELSRSLLVLSDDVREFKAFCSDSFAKDATPVLFRFAVTEYSSMPITVDDGTLFGAHNDWAYKSQQTVFNSFDVIWLKFVKDGVATVIPAVSSPIDIWHDVFDPPADGWPWWVWAIIVVVVVGILALLLKPVAFGLYWLFKILWWIVSAPFKFIIWFVKKAKERKEMK